MADRGMKKWLPFASLVEQGEYLSKMMYEKYKIEKPIILDDTSEIINKALNEYDFINPLSLKIYFDGYIYKIVDKITFIDKNKKLVYFTNFYIPISNILSIEDEIFTSLN